MDIWSLVAVSPWMTLGKQLKLSEFQFLHLYNQEVEPGLQVSLNSNIL